MKSREGILKDFYDHDYNDDEEVDEDSEEDSGIEDDTLELDDDKPGRDKEEEEGRVHRARNLNLGRQHVRNFSAGSAKLLEISPRASVEARRRSPEPRV